MADKNYTSVPKSKLSRLATEVVEEDFERLREVVDESMESLNILGGQILDDLWSLGGLPADESDAVVAELGAQIRALKCIAATKAAKAALDTRTAVFIRSFKIAVSLVRLVAK